MSNALQAIYNVVDNELAQQFIDSNGHKAVMDLLIKKPKGPSSLPLFKTLNEALEKDFL